MPVIRRGEAGDLEQVAAIQAACPEAADWDVADYLKHEFLVAVEGPGVAGPATVIAGFLVSRTVAPDEREILNLAVAPEFRRRRVARGLLENLLKDFHGAVYLEVRESNSVAIKFYNSMQFKELSHRKNYYAEPLNTAIVMKFHSC
jgi:ribosomal-protein-alanine N-acetyltransferase